MQSFRFQHQQPQHPSVMRPSPAAGPQVKPSFMCFSNSIKAALPLEFHSQPQKYWEANEINTRVMGHDTRNEYIVRPEGAMV